MHKQKNVQRSSNWHKGNGHQPKEERLARTIKELGQKAILSLKEAERALTMGSS